jgi:septal ring factor EnvC (AmiA/AmiB activator)
METFIALADQIPDTSQLSGGPTWQIIATALLAVVATIATAYIKSLERRITKTESDLDNLNKLVLRDYHNKQELNQILARIEQGVTAVHRRLDKEFSRAGIHIQRED